MIAVSQPCPGSKQDTLFGGKGRDTLIGSGGNGKAE